MAIRGSGRVRLSRDLVLFALGLAILIHQAFITAELQPELVTAAVALLLAPAVTRVDDARKDGRRQEAKDAEGD